MDEAPGQRRLSTLRLKGRTVQNVSFNGFPLQQNEEYRESWYAGPAIYGVTASGNSTVGFLYYTE